jgi:hypothetical protein
MLLAVSSKVQVCCLSVVGTAGSNLSDSLNINFLSLLCIELAAFSAMSYGLVHRSPTGCICVCDLENSATGRSRAKFGYCDTEEKKDSCSYMYKFIRAYFKITYDKDTNNKKRKVIKHRIGWIVSNFSKFVQNE